MALTSDSVLCYKGKFVPAPKYYAMKAYGSVKVHF